MRKKALSAAEPPYKYITVRESLETLRARIESAERERATSSEQHHYYSSISEYGYERVRLPRAHLAGMHEFQVDAAARRTGAVVAPEQLAVEVDVNENRIEQSASPRFPLRIEERSAPSVSSDAGVGGHYDNIEEHPAAMNGVRELHYSSIEHGAVPIFRAAVSAENPHERPVTEVRVSVEFTNPSSASVVLPLRHCPFAKEQLRIGAQPRTLEGGGSKGASEAPVMFCFCHGYRPAESESVVRL